MFCRIDQDARWSRVLDAVFNHNARGIYVLYDATERPFYVGLTLEGIIARLRRHLGAPRSDFIADRLMDACEIAYVRFYSIEDLLGPIAENATDDEKKAADKLAKHIAEKLELHLYYEFDDVTPLLNVKIPGDRPVEPLGFNVPDSIFIEVMNEEERAYHSDVSYMLEYALEKQFEIAKHCRRNKNTDGVWRHVLTWNARVADLLTRVPTKPKRRKAQAKPRFRKTA